MKYGMYLPKNIEKMVKSSNNILPILFLIVCCFGSSLCDAQTRNTQSENNCNILIALLGDREACNTFKFDKRKDTPIVFIDMKNKFNNCIISDFYEREIEISKDTLDNRVENIKIYNLVKYRNNYELEVHQKFTGAYGKILFKERKGKFYITKFLVGYF